MEKKNAHRSIRLKTHASKGTFWGTALNEGKGIIYFRLKEVWCIERDEKL